MIPDNALGDRLNDVKDGINPKIPKNQDKYIESILKNDSKQKHIIFTVGLGLLTIVNALVVTILYGYAAKLILSIFLTIDWMFLEIIGIGFIMNNVFTYMPKLITNIFKKFTN